MFGPHLVLEGYECKAKNKLANQKAVMELLQEFPAHLNMNIIFPPQVMYYDGGDIPEDKGVSGFVIIAESHIAVHTFADKEFFTLDIFSCKPFSIEAAINFISSYFEPTYCEHKIFDRGREFPRSIGRSAQIINSERCKFTRYKELIPAASVD
jgi:S-adenosylmethionine decarboxylase